MIHKENSLTNTLMLHRLFRINVLDGTAGIWRFTSATGRKIKIAGLNRKEGTTGSPKLIEVFACFVCSM